MVGGGCLAVLTIDDDLGTSGKYECHCLGEFISQQQCTVFLTDGDILVRIFQSYNNTVEFPLDNQ